MKRWPKYLSALIVVLLIAAWAVVLARTGPAEQANRMCPVLLDHEALPEFQATYRGKTVYFCCEHCRDEFTSYPELYSARIDARETKPIDHARTYLVDHYLLIVGTLAALLAVSFLTRLSHQGTPDADKKSLLTRKIGPAIPLFLLCCVLISIIYHCVHRLHHNDLEDKIHFATFYDFGYPPVPRLPEGRKIKRTFYRGNDERSPRLYNGGNYRTATFQLSLCTADGTTIDHDTDLDGVEIFVRLGIDRAPFTPDFLFSDDLLGKMFLTQECDRFLGKHAPPADRVDLTVVDPKQKWEARVPVGKGPKPTRGIIYLCEEYYYDHPIFATKSRGGSRFHFGIRYDLEFENDRLTTQSDLAMGALYRTRKLPSWKVSSDEWFSAKPIPALPSANVNDPKLLGIDDYLD